MIKRLLIIPARKNSKRIKNKNIKIFRGKPIISYSINIAKKSKLFSKIHISTDSNVIKNISYRYGIKIDFIRPKYLSDDNIGLMHVYFYIVKKYAQRGEFFDQIWFLSTCSPLISSRDLIKASKFFNSKNANAMISICKFSPPIQRAFYKKKDNIFPVNKKFIKKKSQNIPGRYFHTGNFGAFKKIIFNKKNIKFKYCGFELPKEKSVDIDNIEDWKLTLRLYKKN
jgi:CMP-N-acetylneuraminic acid synthetase